MNLRMSTGTVKMALLIGVVISIALGLVIRNMAGGFTVGIILGFVIAPIISWIRRR